MLWKRIVEFGFYLLYNQLAWTYDLVSWCVSLGEWRKWQIASLDFVRGPAVLEIAHGPGHMLVEMEKRGWAVIGLDLSPAMGRLAQARLNRNNLADKIPLLRCHIPDIPLRSATFDSILSQFPTSFIFEADTLHALHRLLKPSGVLIILPEGHLTRKGIITRFIHWLFYITGQTIGDEKDPNSLEAFWDNVRNHLLNAGFEASYEIVQLEKSAATIIIAQKI